MPRTFRTPRFAVGAHRALDLLLGFGLGAALVYVLDRGWPGAPGATRHEEPLDDHVLLERVRAALARTVADPRAVDVRVRGGTVILKGPATGEQIAEMIACASRVRGVRGVENRLSPTG